MILFSRLHLYIVIIKRILLLLKKLYSYYVLCILCIYNFFLKLLNKKDSFKLIDSFKV